MFAVLRSGGMLGVSEMTGVNGVSEMMGVNGEKCWRSEGLECGERLEIAGNCCGTEKNVRVLIILKKLKKWALWGGRLLHD